MSILSQIVTMVALWIEYIWLRLRLKNPPKNTGMSDNTDRNEEHKISLLNAKKQFKTLQLCTILENTFQLKY